MRRLPLVLAVVIGASLGTSFAAAAGDRKPVALTPDGLTWEDFSPQRPGVKISQVSGDRLRGAWKGFVRYPPGSKAGLHRHAVDLELVVVSGSFRYGDAAGPEKAYGPGSYLFIPAGLPHTNSTAEETVLFESQPDRFETTPVAPAAK